MYDVSEPKSLAKLQEWVEELQVYSTKKNIVSLVVGNKIDKVIITIMIYITQHYIFTFTP